MKKIIFVLVFLIVTLNNSFSYQEPHDSLGTLITNIVKDVNSRATPIDQLHSEADINIKTKNMDQDGFIEIKLKRNDDFWFRIWGKFAFISKDAFIAHFNRKTFVYFNNLDDKAITGPTTDKNIGYITRVECSFDDMMATLSGAPMINITRKDTLGWAEDNDHYIITMKQGKIKQYFIKKTDNSVEKIAYISRKNKSAYLVFEFSNYTMGNGGYYAKNIKMIKGNTRLTYKITTITFNNSNLNFNVDIPSGTKRIKW